MDECSYLEERVDNQIKWYDKKSIWNQKMFKWLRIFEIILVAIIPVTSVIPINNIITKVLTAVFGAIVSVIVGIQGLCKFHENWIRYRMIAESLKHEKYIYMTNNDKNEFANFVQRIENIISHENINWSNCNKINEKK